MYVYIKKINKKKQVMKFTRSCSCHFCVLMAMCVIFTSTLWNLKTWPARNSYSRGRVCPALHGPEWAWIPKQTNRVNRKEEEEATKGSALALKQDLSVFAIFSPHHPYYQLKSLKTLSTHPETSMMPTWSMYTYHFVVWSKWMASANH